MIAPPPSSRGLVLGLVRGLVRQMILAVAGIIVFASAGRAAQLTVTWADNSNNEQGFVVQRRTLGASYADIAITRANVTSYTDITVTPGETYLYRVRAYNASGASYHSRAASGVAGAVAESVASPTLSAVAGRVVAVNESAGPIYFEVADPAEPAGTLLVSASASDPQLFPAANLIFGGAGGARSLIAIPARDRAGSAVITLVVSNGTRSTSSSFVLTVGATTPPVQMSQVSGVVSPLGYRLYFGTVGNAGGQFGLCVQQDRSAVLIAVAPSFPSGTVMTRLTLSVEGEFAAEIPGIGTVRGKVDNVTVAGVFGASGLRMSGTQESVRLLPDSQTGYFQGVIAGSTVGEFHAVVGSSGRALVAVAERGVYSGGAGVLDAQGQFSCFPDTDERVTLTVRNDGAVVTGQWMLGSRRFDLRGRRNDLPNDTRLVNISVRARTGFGADSMISGFTLGGEGSKAILLRAVGPTLGSFGVANALPDPLVTLQRRGADVGAAPYALNDNWSWMDIPGSAVASAAFPLQLGSRDAALFLPLPVGGYTASVTDAGEGNGIALVELYDADNKPDQGGARITNLSLRGKIDVGDDVIVAGFALSGDAPQRLLMRAIGMELADFGVPGALSDPAITLYRNEDGQSLEIAKNNDFGFQDTLVTAVSSRLGAFPLNPGTRSSVLLLWLAPGVYTAHVRSSDGKAGVVLLEMYEAP
ncbi:MAG: fibronectin type III domain-containing protein [Opitutaceae bacterium]|nr:fibronectin type III domain-containing protein [Opitutaceae bacterium]